MDTAFIVLVVALVCTALVAFNFRVKEREARQDAAELRKTNETLASAATGILRLAEQDAAKLTATAQLAATSLLKNAETQAAGALISIQSSERKLRELDTALFGQAEQLASLQSLVVAERNRVEGWQDQYALPLHLLLDGLGEHMGWTEAGVRLKQAREVSKLMVKEKKAILCHWGDEDYKKDAIRLMHEAFDSQVDLAIEKVKGDENVGKVLREIRDIAASLNDYAKRCMRAQITLAYVEARVDEARWGAVAYELRQQERTEQRLTQARIREEEKVAREIERDRKEADKEEELTRRAMLKAQQEALDLEKAQQREYEVKLREMERAMKAAALKDEDERKDNEAAIKAQMEALLREKDRNTEEQRLKYATDNAELLQRLQEAEEKNQRALSMAQQTKRGYVYIISNHGSFGDAILKVGMTRRLDPMDRVWELGDASVPFDFDVHALILTDDAPGLEGRLHRIMAEQRVNKVNLRKEYFRLTIADVRAAVEQAGVKAEWMMTAKALEYKETVALEEAFKLDPAAKQKWLQSTGAGLESE